MESTLMNSTGMWISCSIMIIVVVTQSVIYFSLGKKEAERLGISKEIVGRSMRTAAITVLGPTFAVAIVLLSLVITLGTPMAWMRLNDIGAARTELAVVSLAQSITPEGATADEAFAFASWGMALNNCGWMLVTLLITKRMGWATGKLNSKFNPLIVKAIMGGAAAGLFAFLLSNNIVGKKPPHIIAAIASGIAIIIINKLFSNNQRMQELSLGLSMIVGMVFGSLSVGLAI